MADRFRVQARTTEQYCALSRYDSVPALLRAACLAMEKPILALALTLRVELNVPIVPELRELLLGTAYLTSALTAQFRQETHVGCVDRVFRRLVQAFTLGEPLTGAQWRLASSAIRRADLAVGLIAIDVLDLLETHFGFADSGGAHARYELLLGLPQVAHHGVSIDQNIYVAVQFSIFERLAGRL